MITRTLKGIVASDDTTLELEYTGGDFGIKINVLDVDERVAHTGTLDNKAIQELVEFIGEYRMAVSGSKGVKP